MIRSILCAFAVLVISISVLHSQTQTVGLFLNNPAKTSPGYVLLPAMHNGHTYLIDNDGQVVNTWYADNSEPGRMAYLLPNGHLLRSVSLPNSGPNTGRSSLGEVGTNADSAGLTARATMVILAVVVAMAAQAQSTYPELKLLPAGEFQIGDHYNFVDPQHPSDERPLHMVWIDSMYIGTYDITNSQYVEFLTAQVLAASAAQINFVVPAATATGQATITASNAAVGTVVIDTVAPGLFSANADGKGVAAAIAVHVKSDGSQTSGPIFQCGSAAGSCAAAPLDLGAASDQLILLLFGTGMRNFTQQAVATVGDTVVGIAGPVAQGQFVGLDQVNLGPLPRSLAGRGEVNIVLSVDGKQANSVTVNVK